MENNLPITENVDASAEESAIDEEGLGQPGSESTDHTIQTLAEKVDQISEAMLRMIPVVERLNQRDMEAGERNVVVTPEDQRKKWDQRRRQDPTFTDFAGALAFSSPETPNTASRRRETIFEEAGTLEKSAKVPTFRRNVPAFHGKLKSLKFSEINQFFTELYAYQSEHNAYERGCPHIHWSVRSMLVPIGMNDQLFMQIPNGELFALIRHEIRPHSPAEFRQIFVEGLFFSVREGFELGASTFREWCSLIKVYFREVQQRYEFLAEDLDRELVPSLEDKESGLINLVLIRMIPYDTAKTLHDEFYYQFKQKNKGFTLVDYLSAFQSTANRYVQRARDSIALNAAISTKPKFSSYSRTSVFPKSEYAQQRKFDTPRYSSNSTTTETKNVQFVENGVPIHGMDEAELQEVINWADGISPPDGIAEKINSEPEMISRSISIADDEKSELLNFAAEAHQPLKPMTRISPPTMGANRKLYVPGEKRSPGDFPCIRFVIDGRCPFGNECKNSHDEGRCREYYYQIIKKLQNESPVRPVAQVKQQVSALTEELNSHVMSLSKNVDVVKLVFCTGLIMLSHKTIMVHKILLDSGALHGNYISDTFLHTHGDRLYSLMEHTDELIILADASKSCHVSKKIRLVMRVHSGIEGCNDVTFSGVFSVLTGLKHDLIIGLPALVSDLVDLFVARILSLKGTARSPSQVTDSVHNLMVLSKGQPKGRGRPKRVLNTESVTIPDGFQMECSSDSLGVIDSPNRPQFLHDSVNPSLKKKCLKRFVASDEFKGSYPDGDMQEVSYPEVLEHGPILNTNSPSVFRALPKVNRPIVTRLKEILEESEASDATCYKRVQVMVDDEWDQLRSRPMYVQEFPREIPYVRVPFTECNDFRERLPVFQKKLAEFQVHLSQVDHIGATQSHRSEPFLRYQKDMLQECVHVDGVYAAVSTMINLDESFPRHGLSWDTVRSYQYACRFCRERRWFAPLSRHRSHDCPFLQKKYLETVYNLTDWCGVMCPPGYGEQHAITNTGPYMRFQLDKDPNAWMYWVRNVVVNRLDREVQVNSFRSSLQLRDVQPIQIRYGMVNPMLSETHLEGMNEAVYSRIDLAHHEAGCTTDILLTVLMLDSLFPGHTIDLNQVLHFILACNSCKARCEEQWEYDGVHPYLLIRSISPPLTAHTQEDDSVAGSTPDTTEVHHLGSLEVIYNPNEDDSYDSDDDWYSSEFQSDSLFFDEAVPTLDDDVPSLEKTHMNEAEYCAEMKDWPNPNLVNDPVEDVHVPMYSLTVAEYIAPPNQKKQALDDMGIKSDEVEEGDILHPWSSDLLDEEAPEDTDTPQPSNFDVPLAYMNKTLAQATDDFHAMIVTRVSPVMAESTSVVRNLKGRYLAVFVPHNWNGITGIPPVVIEVTPDIPMSRKPKARPVNPRMMGHVHKEYLRLCGYFYVPSTSPWASCLVIAAKKTEPFCRFCGDYREINKYIKARHSPIPNVGNEILRISSYQIFADLDMKTSFHQLPLAEASRQYLSIQTPWGQVEPLYVPEGSKPASGALQDIVRLLFGHLDYVIAIFDNLLVLANTALELEVKLYCVLDICLAHNVVLGFAKCNIGVKEVEFFGYVCSHKQYKLSDSRKESIVSLPFPRNQKEVQQVMGTANMFLRFTPNYSTIAKDITDMSAKSFNWDESSWKVDHRAAYDRFKEAITASLTLYYPDYNLNWIMRTDASLDGCGVVLYQEYVAPDGILQEQVISVLSHKFSGAATRWPTIEQEAFAIYFGVKKLEYLLMCKSFVVETDHRNLVWMGTSLVAKIIRWRIYLQGFNMTIRHIKGKDNVTADWLSRIHSVALVQDDTDTKETPQDTYDPDMLSSTLCTPRECFLKVHGGRMGHPGTVRTLKLLNKYFPSHGMSQEVVANLVSECPHCQKVRIGIDSQLVPMHRTLSQTHLHAAIGCDTLTVSPVDDSGYKYIIVIVNLFSKFTVLYPVTNHDAISLATSLFQYYCTYGVCERIISDPGSDLTSDVVRHLNSWFGIRHVFSLVERHQSNGVEGSNKSILRHLRSLVHDERLVKRWSHPTILPLIQYMLNCEFESSESGIVPLHAHFGNHDQVFQQLPNDSDPEQIHHEYVQLLADNVQLVREISRAHQAKVALERTQQLPSSAQTKFQPGDFVLKRLEHRPSKLMFQLSGPYRVVSQHKNDVQVRSLVFDNIVTFNIDHLKLFIGTEHEARTMAMLDKNQYLITEILAYRGDPARRSTCLFLIQFDDGDLIWVPYSRDIAETQQFETFCNARSELYLLLFSAAEASTMMAAINRTNISEVAPGCKVYVNLRFFGFDWYNSLGLPNSDTINYVVVFTYQHWFHKTTFTKIVAACHIFDEIWPVNHYFVRAFGSKFVPDAADVVVTSALIHQYPQIITSSKPGR